MKIVYFLLFTFLLIDVACSQVWREGPLDSHSGNKALDLMKHYSSTSSYRKILYESPGSRDKTCYLLLQAELDDKILKCHIIDVGIKKCIEVKESCIVSKECVANLTEEKFLSHLLEFETSGRSKERAWCHLYMNR